MWAAYHNYRTITTLEAIMRLTLQMRRCLNPACPQVRKPYRPEAEGRLALPKHEFGLDVIAWVGTLRYAQHRSLPEIHQHLGLPRMAGQNVGDRGPCKPGFLYTFCPPSQHGPTLWGFWAK